jgi:hypothetical protein
VDSSLFKTKTKEIHDNLFNNYFNYIQTGIIDYGTQKQIIKII